MMKKEKKLLLTTLTLAFSFAMLTACNKEKKPEPTIEFLRPLHPRRWPACRSSSGWTGETRCRWRRR